jgi:hypothetical protein
MKRLLTFATTMLLSTGLIFAQADKPKELNPQPLPPGIKADNTKPNEKTSQTSGKKGHKGGKKGKKSSGTTTTPPPK